jgi:hypothetical protein
MVEPNIEVKPYGPLVEGNVTESRVIAMMARVKKSILEEVIANPKRKQSDVVVLYYQGRELRGTDGTTYLTTDDHSQVRCSDIVNTFSDTPGAHVVMLDVQRDGRETAVVSQELEHNRMGQLHYSWLAGGGEPARRLLGLLRECWPKASNLNALALEIESMTQQVPQAGFRHSPRELAALFEFGGKGR